MKSVTNKSNRPDGFYTAEMKMPASKSKDKRPVLIPGSLKPLVLNSLEERAVAEVMAEQIEKVGAKDGAEIRITSEMFKAKLKQLKQQNRRRR